MPSTVIMYMTSWCSDCMRSRKILQRSGASHIEIDIDKVPGAEVAMMAINGGSGKVPTILVDGKVLIEPSDLELEKALRPE